MISVSIYSKLQSVLLYTYFIVKQDSGGLGWSSETLSWLMFDCILVQKERDMSPSRDEPVEAHTTWSCSYTRVLNFQDVVSKRKQNKTTMKNNHPWPPNKKKPTKKHKNHILKKKEIQKKKKEGKKGVCTVPCIYFDFLF